MHTTNVIYFILHIYNFRKQLKKERKKNVRQLGIEIVMIEMTDIERDIVSNMLEDENLTDALRDIVLDLEIARKKIKSEAIVEIEKIVVIEGSVAIESVVIETAVIEVIVVIGIASRSKDYIF